ncbi:putative adenylyltransferase/sulfurtransferase MoeZ [Leucobacter soli]|uniref:Adenylyltransferase/sulfurtransferase MoeZ n=2 Tax=Leucobacter soli TaxID=2812850 RepID=A0A916NGC9_9MICO|nr:ThiF family adenylyltransferase [Leucobacter soli]CAG7602835.1 putative adenylyltransferase/sulfurtransferase MoeZ [Leucobacter soli]
MPADRGSAVEAGSRPGPLVEPGPPLTAEQAERAARQMRLPGFGEVAQRRLRAARVLVIGAGGLGSASVPYLVGAGIGTIGIVDDDAVELSNLHRQVAHRTVDLGRSKAVSLAEAAQRVDPGVDVIAHELRLSSANALGLLADYDLVIDGSDNFPTRYLANDAARLAGIPLVWGAILGHHGQVGVAWHAYGPGYRDLFPQPPAPDEVVTCATGGVLPGLCGTIGSLLATEAMKLIAGVGEPLIGRVLVYDALGARTREIRYARDPLATAPAELIDYEAFCAGPGAPPGVTGAELRRRIEGGPTALLDVRGLDERAGVRISPSESLPLPVLEGPAASVPIAPGSRVTVYCARGPRSVRAARILRERGFDADYLIGGIEEFARTAPEHVVHGSAQPHPGEPA